MNVPVTFAAPGLMSPQPHQLEAFSLLESAPVYPLGKRLWPTLPTLTTNLLPIEPLLQLLKIMIGADRWSDCL
jgi:hypothetical protein